MIGLEGHDQSSRRHALGLDMAIGQMGAHIGALVLGKTDYLCGGVREHNRYPAHIISKTYYGVEGTMRGF